MEKLHICPICGIFLHEPYINCVECYHSFCLQCFSKGKEYENHKSNHQYSVVRNNFSIFDYDWCAQEEIKLLTAIADHGIGNWSEIAKDVGTKNKVECEEHYLKHFIYNPKSPLPEIPDQEQEKVICHPVPVACTTSAQEPPRPTLSSASYQEMAGYMPARGDFTFEYDDYAEMDIKELAFEDDDPLWNELQMSVLDIYQQRLKERSRRKWLIKQYGLLCVKQNGDDWMRYAALGSSVLDQMKPLMRLFEPESFYKFLEGMLWEHRTKKRIELLQDCRTHGITRTHSIPTFLKMRRKQEERRRTKSALDEVLHLIKDEGSCLQLIRKQVLKDSFIESALGRRPAPPLNIATMPGFDKLTFKERELCSSLRVIPASFLQYKSTLVNEYRKLGSLRLANARNVIKIDVNKTRKIYDLLIEEGVISKS